MSWRAPLSRISLRLKLTLGYALIFSLTALIFAAGVYLAARSELRATLDAGLLTTAGAARQDLAASGRPQFSAGFKTSRETYVELLDAAGRRLDAVGNVDEAQRLPLPHQDGFVSTAERRVYTVHLPSAILRVSRPSDTLTEVLETLGRVMLLGAVALVGVACLAGYWLADRALRPVDAVAGTARRIARQGNYTERVPVAPGGDEMARLTSTVNEMLDQLQGTIEREKNFARTAAHELRTPLTALRGRLELALDRPRDAEGYRKSLQAMQGRVEGLIELSEQLLALARAEGPAQLERVELAALALEVADGGDLGPVQLDVEESWVLAEPAGVRQVMHNLLENARKYAPAGGVTLFVRRGELAVLDSGAGPSPADWARLTRPFERGAQTQGTPGSGLGLALVAALCARWQARLSPEWLVSGFAVRVSWPMVDGR